MKATQVIYEGRVQGVGFRWNAKRVAQGFDVTGWVQNLPDGRVELQVSGDPAEVEAFLAEMRDCALAGLITGEQIHPIEITTPHRGFQIIP